MSIFLEVIIKNKHFINEDIIADKVKVISENGEQLGILDLDEAIEIAQSKKMDLVLVGMNANPKVCRIMDYGKFLFEQSKREKANRRLSKANEMKEIRISSNIAEHDINHKAKLVKDFIEKDHKVKITMRLRGREMQKKELAFEVMDEMLKAIGEDLVEVEKKPFLMGRTIQMILSKNKK